MRERTRESKRTQNRRAIRKMNKSFGSDMAPRDDRHHHTLVPIRVGRNVSGYECASAGCEELFTPSGNVSSEFTIRPGKSRLADVPRRSWTHRQRKEIADAG
jgi:hypothetical protein